MPRFFRRIDDAEAAQCTASIQKAIEKNRNNRSRLILQNLEK